MPCPHDPWNISQALSNGWTHLHHLKTTMFDACRRLDNILKEPTVPAQAKGLRNGTGGRRAFSRLLLPGILILLSIMTVHTFFASVVSVYPNILGRRHITGPSVAAMPAQGKSFDKFTTDTADCQSYAQTTQSEGILPVTRFSTSTDLDIAQAWYHWEYTKCMESKGDVTSATKDVEKAPNVLALIALLVDMARAR
jgi:hypothetical protein